MVVHLIYIYLIIFCVLVSIYWETEYNFKTNLATALLLLFFPFLFLYIFLNKVSKNDYVFFIRALYFGFKIQNKERLLHNIKLRKKNKGKIWSFFAHKLINKITKK